MLIHYLTGAANLRLLWPGKPFASNREMLKSKGANDE